MQFDDMGDEDDDDYDEEEDDDDDDEYYAGEGHNIHTLLNPYNEGGDLGGSGGQMGIPMQTMSILQGLLNMNNGSMGDGVAGAISGGMGGMGSPMDGGAGGFLPNMQSFLPNDITGALAGAFGGGVGAIMDSYGGGGATLEDYDEDDEEELSDDDDAETESDEEDEDEDDDDQEDKDEMMGVGTVVAAGAMGAVGGLMASAIMAHQHPSSGSFQPDFHSMMQPPRNALPPPQVTMAPVSSPPPMAVAALPSPNVSNSPAATLATTLVHTTPAPVGTNSMSGGTVSRVDPFAALTLAGAGAVAANGILASGVNTLSSSGGKTLINNKLNTSDASNTTIIAANDSLNTSNKTITNEDVTISMTNLLNKTHISTPNTQQQPHVGNKISNENNVIGSNSSQNIENKQATVPVVMNPPKPTRVIKDDSDDDKASVPGSETSGGGKSDTESVRKKTPSPVLTDKMGRLSPTSSESTHGPELASCASITDLASATESMRDSDTDNHSDAHNVTANLSDLDNDLHEQQKMAHLRQQYPSGAMPLISEVPTHGWESMVGLETPKEQLKKLFFMSAFPEVFEKGSLKA